MSLLNIEKGREIGPCFLAHWELLGSGHIWGLPGE